MPQEQRLQAIKEELLQQRGQLIRPSRGMAQSDVYLVEVDGQKAIVKDFSKRRFLSRHLVCRLIVQRELSVLRALSDTGLVPEIYGQLNPFSLVLEHLDGVSPGRHNAGQWPDAFQKTADFLNDMHARGFAHNDFRRDNLMVMADGSVHFFDFAAALRKPQRFRLLLFPITLLVNLMQRLDQIGLLKMKPDLTGQPLSEAEKKLAEKPFIVRSLRDLWKHCINQPLLRRLK